MASESWRLRPHDDARVPRYLFPILVVLAIAVSQGLELFVNRVLRPDAEEITWISDLVLASGFIVVTWLWVRLRETQIALTGLERQQIVADTQLTIAARVQASLLPRMPQQSGGITWYGEVESANRIGGDYFDLFPLANGGMCVVLGDVSGKGLAAALFVANVRAILRTLARDATRPALLMASLSDALLANSTSGLYVTCIVAMVDPVSRSMVYANAGHPAGVLWSTGGARGLPSSGPPAGLLAGAPYKEETIELTEGDLVVFVSDGVTEALDASGQGAVDAIARQIEAGDRKTPEAVCARLLAAARQGSGPGGIDDWTDDRTAVAFSASVKSA